MENFSLYESLLELITLQADSGYWPFVSSLLSPEGWSLQIPHLFEYGQEDVGAEEKNLEGRGELLSLSCSLVFQMKTLSSSAGNIVSWLD